jgi:DNA (cytosine-5)-methyltransferase 1
LTEPTVKRRIIPQLVRVRRHDVDTEALRELLRSAKHKASVTNRQLAESLSRPVTEVEHWFRTDDCFSIPDAAVWRELKTLLGVMTDDFDAPVTEFITKEGVFEKSHRCYEIDGLAPTLTSTSADEKIIVPDGAIKSTYREEAVIIPTEKTFKYVSLFSGIGGFETALNRLGGECVMASEIDKFANQAYDVLYGEPTVGDLTKVDAKDVPNHDLLVGGFPCQSFSVAGKRLGFDDTRGTLFFEVARIAREKRPKLILLENVKGLVGHDAGKTLDTIVQTLNDIGYTVDFEVLNSKYFGVPQNRERIFIVGVLNGATAEWHEVGDKSRKDVVAKGKRRIAQLEGVRTFNFDWPAQGEVTTRLRDILEDNVDERYYLSEEKTAKLVAQLEEHGEPNTNRDIKMVGHAGIDGHDFNRRIYSVEGVSRTLNTASDIGRSVKVAEPTIVQRSRGKNKGGVHDLAPTLTSNSYQDNYHDGVAIGNKEVSDASEKERNAIKVLRELWDEVGEETFAEWGFRVLDSFQSTKILRQELHGEELQRERINERPELDNSAQAGEDDKEGGNLRNMWFNKERGDSPQRRELEEQLTRELTNIMQELSLKGSSFEVLFDLWSEAQRIGILRQTLSKIQEIWRSTDNKVRYRIRKLTPLETFRLQGFPDEYHAKLVAANISNSQLYKMAGNAVTVNVIDAIGKRLITWLKADEVEAD